MRRKNLIAGSICLAVLPCFALFAVAQQQRPAAQQPAASQQPPLPRRGLLTTSQCLLVFRYDISRRGHSHPLPLAILQSQTGFLVRPTEYS